MDKYTRRSMRISIKRQRKPKVPTSADANPEPLWRALGSSVTGPGRQRTSAVVWVLILVSAVLSLCLYAYRANDVLRVAQAWLPPTVPGQTRAAGYIRLRSARTASVVKVDTDVASSVEIYQRQIDNGVSRMQRVDRVELPAGQAVALTSEARHLELVNLRRPLVLGERVRLTLTLRLDDGRYAQEQVVASVSKNVK